MRVLVACEESQRVCIAFRELGHEAYSCDLLPCSGGHPEWHIQGDALELIKIKWDLVIAHPPCTYLSSVSACRLFDSNGDVKDPARAAAGWEAKRFFLRFFDANADKICIENPAALKFFGLPKYSQIIEPYYFGDTWKKRTCLWLVGLPPLYADRIVEPKSCWTIRSGGSTCRVRLKGDGTGARNQRERARTFPGIARAMAEQWGGDARGA